MNHATPYYELANIYEPTLVLNPDAVRIGHYSRIDSFCKLEGGLGLTVGKYVHVASFCHLNVGGGELQVGDHCFFASHSVVVSGGNKPEGQSMSAASPKAMQVVIPHKVVFKDYSGTYCGALVMPGVTFHEGAVALPGSVVRSDIPAWEIWGGNPCRFIRKREPVSLDEDWLQRDADLRASAQGVVRR